MLEEEEDSSDSGDATLRSLQTEVENRESPNTSMSTTSSIGEHKSSEEPRPSNEDNDKESNARYLFARAIGARAKSSIPSRLSPAEYAQQCTSAAENSRLNPYALHPKEHEYLQDKLCQLHVTVYLNIRNGILRLWVRNPSVAVTIEEAVGCAKDERWSRLACFAYEWLLRNGFINFGCVEAPAPLKGLKARKREGKRQTIVVIGGGMAGLSTARQLTSLFQHYPDQTPPRIVILEGRKRIGGRIYSHPLTSMQSGVLDPGQRPTAEMGAHIIVGFERGNPLDAIVRGQLALKYHLLRDLSTLYDVDGTPVNENNDTMIERLYNDVLDRTGHYRLTPTIKQTARGDKEMIDAGREPPEEESITIRQYEEATASGTLEQMLPKKSRRRGAGHKAAKLDKPMEEADTDMQSKMQLPAAQAAKEFGFLLRKTTDMADTLELDYLASQENQSLGNIMNEGVNQYQKFLELRPFALRLMNWHFANLEYANAANIDKLSLVGWDQDIGNEFEGEHAQVVGGYQQVPRALWRYPDPLDVRTNKAIKAIHYDAVDVSGKATVVCEDGEKIQADRIVLSVPLGVLKEQSIQFTPSLPDWKQTAIKRIGFGLLNKVILVFEKPFWPVERDMFGLLRPPKAGSGFSQSDYVSHRGQFYLFWNTIETSGLPVLIALVAGDAAWEAESLTDQQLTSQCYEQLQNIFGKNIPKPIESICTRWRSDRFARGTYSFVAHDAEPGDYDLISKSIGNLFFAGEATCRTHPATVHGAYLSGLRAANEVLESILDRIQIPPTLVPSAVKAKAPSVDLTLMDTHLAQAGRRKGDELIPAGTFTRPVKERDNLLHEAWDAAMWVRIYDDLGPPPVRPAKRNVNAFLLYSMEHWNAVKERITARQKEGHRRGAKTERDAVRVELGKMWAQLDEVKRGPYHDETKGNREANDRDYAEWHEKAKDWDRRTWEVKDAWIKEGNGFEEFCARKRAEDEMMDLAAG